MAAATAPRTDFGAWFAGVERHGDALPGAEAPTTSIGAASGGSAGSSGGAGPVSGAFGLAAWGSAAAAAVGAAAAGAIGTVAGSGAGATSSAVGAAGGKAGVLNSGAGGARTPNATGARASSSDRGAAADEETASFLPGLPSFLRPSSAGSGAGANAAASGTSSSSEWTCGLSTAQRFQAFLMLLLGSALLFGLALFVFLPMIVLVPSKFAMCFTLASIMFMAAFGILRGPRTTLQGFLQRDKLPFTAAYVGSLLLTLYATVIAQSYLLCVLALGVQVPALSWYAASYIPGGTSGLAAMTRWFCSGMGSLSRGVFSLVAR